MTSNSRPFDGFDDDTDSGGGGGVPTILPPDINGTGNITTTGNFTANGDGVNTGRINSQIIEAQSGKIINNLIVENGNLNVTNGGVNAGSGDVTAFEYKLLGTNIIKTTVNPVSNTEYCQSKGCAFLPSTNLFTATNTFQQDIVLSGVGKNLVNSQGGLVSATSNIETMTCGSVDCSNGGFNSVKAKEVNFRVGTETNGFKIRQESATDPLGGYLQVQGGSAGDSITIIDNAHSIQIPSIELDPQTQVLGGKITANQYNIGFGTEGFLLNQPRSGTDTDNLRVMCGVNNGEVRFENYGGTTSLVRIQQDPVDGSGRIYTNQIYFGTTGLHNSIVNDVSGAGNLNLKIRQATASSEVLFLDNADAELIRVRKTQIELKDDLPLLFGNYSFRPQQYSLTKTLTISANPDTATFTNMAFNCRTDSWTDVNSGASGVTLYNVALEGYYKCTISQTALSSSGNFNFCDIIFDYILRLSIQTTPDITYTEPRYGYRKKPTNQASPTIEIDHLNTPVQSQPVYVLYSGQNSGETMPIEVRLTKLDY